MAKSLKLTWKGILGAISSRIDEALLRAAETLGDVNNKAAVTIKINLTRQDDGRIEFFPEAETKGKQYSIGSKAKGKSIIAELIDGNLQNIQIGMFDKKGIFKADDQAETTAEESTITPEDETVIEEAMAQTAED